jgi:hypothetical protein
MAAEHASAALVYQHQHHSLVRQQLPKQALPVRPLRLGDLHRPVVHKVEVHADQVEVARQRFPAARPHHRVIYLRSGFGVKAVIAT